ncbi:hypothetical protein Tco_0015838 [Tanacetum coccineum]
MAPGRHPTVNQNPPVNRSTNRNTPDINSGIDTQMLNQLIATRVAEALAAVAVTHAASTQEETNLSWNLNSGLATLLKNDFKAMFIRKYCPLNEVKQMENDLWNLKVKGLPLNIKGNVTSSKPVDLHEAIEMAQGLMYQVVQELGENFGDKRKWNGNHYNNNNTNNVGNFNQNKRPETARVFTAGQSIYAANYRCDSRLKGGVIKGRQNHGYYSSVVSNLPRVKSRGFLQLRVKIENSSDQEQDGKDKSVKSSSLIGSLMPRGLKEAQEMMIFALDHSHN